MEYPAITLYSRVANVLSWIVAAVSFLFGILGLANVVATSFNGDIWVGVLTMLVIWVLGFFGWLGIRIVPEVLQLLMRLETNTRH